jgi:TonB family protein
VPVQAVARFLCYIRRVVKRSVSAGVVLQLRSQHRGITMLTLLVRKRVVFALLAAAIAIPLISLSVAAQYEASGAIQAIEEKPSSAVRRSDSETSEGRGSTPTAKMQSSPQKKNVSTKTQRSVSTPAAGTKYNGPIAGDSNTFLNFEITDKVAPVWSQKAKSAGALGLVQVTVLIGVDGRVLQARARYGNPLLYPESEAAALATTFNRPILNGRPVRGLGFVVYRFGTEEQEYDQEQNKLNGVSDSEGLGSAFYGGVLNEKAITMPKPIYPPEAKAAGVRGQVVVQVMINEKGDVTSAYALSGDQLLRDAAEVAGRAAKFSPIKPNSKLPGRYGKLVYDFTP